jgi:hypothetical protein
MNEEHAKKIWKYVKEHVQKWIKDDTYWGGDSALQKEQYLAYRKEIIAYFDQQLGARVKAKESAATLIETYPYFQDIADMGIDPYAIFDASIERGWADSDYQRWKDGGSGWVRRKQTPSIQDMISGKAEHALHPKTPSNFAQPTKKNPLIGSNKPVWSPDSDVHQWWGAGQIDGDTDHGDHDHH